MSVLCEKLADDNMAHNIAFIRGKRLNHEIDSDEFVLRVYIWPRRPTLGSRVLGATKKICIIFLNVESFSKSYFRKGQNYSETN